jgi:hypothetical protein
MRFGEAYEGWNEGRLTQAEAATLLGMSERNFRRYLVRFEAEGLQGLIDRRLEQVSHRRAPVDEVLAVTEQYRKRHLGWNVRHFHAWYRREGGSRSYSWVKKQLQAAGLVEKFPKKSGHRKKRERMPLPGMMIHQVGSRHEWVPGHLWDLIVTMDDATNEHYDMRFVEEEGTASSFQGIRTVILERGLPCSFYSDRGSHYWTTPQAGGKVDKAHPTQFGRALRQLGIEMIPAYSPEVWPAPTAILPRSIGLASMPSSPCRPGRKVAPSCPGSAAIWTTSCASSSSAPSATTIASGSRG